MEALLAIAIGVLVAASVYLMLARNVLRFIFGLVLMSNAANLTIFVAGRLTQGAPPLISEGDYAPVGDVANALPQALVLTAIVIGVEADAIGDEDTAIRLAINANLADAASSETLLLTLAARERLATVRDEWLKGGRLHLISVLLAAMVGNGHIGRMAVDAVC